MGTLQTGDDIDATDALELLIEQHDTIDLLIEQLFDPRVPDERKELLFRTLADVIAAHAAIEETLFYPAVRERATADFVRESLADHAAIKRELADLVLSEFDDPRFAARLQILQAQLDHHAHDQEEGVLFPHVREVMSDEELAHLGTRMRALYDLLLTDEPLPGMPRPAREVILLHAR